MNQKYNRIFDSHAHYTDRAFDVDRNSLLLNLAKNGVEGVITAASNIEDAKKCIELSEKFDFVKPALGVHPLDCKTWKDSDIPFFDKAKIIGEIGLDYHYDGYDKDLQMQILEWQLDFAVTKNLPVIIHSRESTADCMAMLLRYRPSGVLHCFSDDVSVAKKVLSLGMYLGFTGVVTYKSANMAREVVKYAPTDKILIETDCPYMSPVPHRGKRCDSSMLVHTAAAIAEIKGLDVQTLFDITYENTRKCFRL
ncbi:MAG: TatD family hydrolase [Ruminococcus sp.]|nr:TatD family hydrolase [Ruminococcus sp.]